MKTDHAPVFSEGAVRAKIQAQETPEAFGFQATRTFEESVTDGRSRRALERWRNGIPRPPGRDPHRHIDGYATPCRAFSPVLRSGDDRKLRGPTVTEGPAGKETA